MATNCASNFGTGTAGQILTSNGEGNAPTFQDLAARGGIPSIPKWAKVNSNLWWSPVPYKALGNIGVTGSTIYGTPFVTYGSFTITAVAITCGFYSVSSSLEFALYSCASAGTGTLINSLGTVSVTGTGLKTITSLSQAVSPGWYYLCFQPSNSANQYNYASTTNTACFVNKTDTGVTMGGVSYAKGTAGFPASITAGQFGTILGSNSFVLLMQGA